MRDWQDRGSPPDKSVKLEFALMLILWIAAFVGALLVASAPATAHPGGLAKDGCHMDRSTGKRHCHRGGGTAEPETTRGGEVYYQNCAAVRAAGKAPIRRGQPGYRPALDRDGDGVGCE